MFVERNYYRDVGRASYDPNMEALILDNGSSCTKCGFSGDDTPRHIFPSIVGRPKNPSGIMVGMDAKDCFVGDEAVAKRGILKLKYPIEHGMVTNWNDMDKIWHHTFYELMKVYPDDHPILMTESPLNPRNNREKMVSIMYETFNVPAIYIALPAVLSLYYSGFATGVVLESGYGLTNTVPIYEGCAINHAILRMNIAGRDISDYQTKIIEERVTRSEYYTKWTDCSRFKVDHDIKKKLGYVAIDFESELKKNSNKNNVEYQLPGGDKVIICDERFRAPEILFSPGLIGSEEYPGIHETLYNSIQKCDRELHRRLYSSIVLSGGSTMFEGFVERLRNEVRSLSLETNNENSIEVHATPQRSIGAWLGGSIITKLSSMDKMWIKMDEYDDAGATIVHRKCFTGGCAGAFKPRFIGISQDDDLKERILYCSEKVNVFKFSFGGVSDFSLSKCFLML